MPYKRTVGHACLYFSTSREPAVGPPWKRQVRSLHMRACAQYLLHRFLEQENGIHQDYGVHASVMRLASGRRPSTCLCALRTLTLLQALQLEHSPSPSNQALPALTASTSRSSAAGGARRKPTRKVSSCMDAVLPHYYDSPAVDLTDFGLHIGYLPDEGELQMSTCPETSPAAVHRAQLTPAAAQAEEDQPVMRG
eukprot:scaffold58472_cov17-Tisochrysis_lutea.AAC.1